MSDYSVELIKFAKRTISIFLKICNDKELREIEIWVNQEKRNRE